MLGVTIAELDQRKVVVDKQLARLVACQRARALESTVALFTPDALMFGSARDEAAVGTDDIRRFFRERFDLPMTFGWTWDDLVVQGDGEQISFVANGNYDLRGPGEGDRDVGAYRIAGVLRRSGEEWLFSMFSGCRPSDSALV